MIEPNETHFGDDYDDEDDYEADETEKALNECGQWHGGGCLMAGTEHCDFKCPYRDVDLFKNDDEEEEDQT